MTKQLTTRLKDKILDLCSDILENEEESYLEYLEENGTGEGHLYDLAIQVRNEVEELDSI